MESENDLQKLLLTRLLKLLKEKGLEEIFQALFIKWLRFDIPLTQRQHCIFAGELTTKMTTRRFFGILHD